MSRKSAELRRKNLAQALVRLLVDRLVAQRGELHRSCDSKGWCWPKTKEESGQLDRIDQALTELGFFSTSSAGGES